MTARANPRTLSQIATARSNRALLASRLIMGACELEVLGDYRATLIASRLLGDITAEEAETSYARAVDVYAINVTNEAASL
jgi:hypothetical protein